LAMRTRSGMQYRNARPNWMGPSLSRRTMAQRRSFARSRTLNRRRRPSSGQGITTQHDERRIYRKKSMPRFQRKRWKRFKNKVLAVSEKDLGTRTVVFNKTYAATNTVSGNHTISDICLYGFRSSADSRFNDLTQIQAYENAGNPTAAAGGTVDATSKFIFKSAILDVTVRNTSTYYDGAAYALNSAAKMEVDVYEILVNSSSSTSSTAYLSLGGLITASTTDTLRIGGAGTDLVQSLRGWTPFDAPAALSRWKIKILKKTKFMVPNGDTFTYQIRDPKRRVCDSQALAQGDGCNKVGWTRWLYLIGKLVPGLIVSPDTPNTYQESISIGITRKYFYKVEGQSEDRDRYDVL